jgi:LysR family transcriptional regulator, nod-box dependent transcriptional activator
MSLAKHDLNLLITLNALLSERNVTRAAKRLGLSQPAVSAALARLRDTFEDELLVRVGRNLEPTPLAQRLVTPLQQAISQIEDVLSTRNEFDPDTERRTFRIAARDYVTFLLMPELMRTLRASAPRISVSFSPLDAGSLTLLADNRIDFVVLPDGYQQQFPSEHLFDDHWVCAVWTGHPTVGETLSKEQYLSLEHLIFLPGPGKRVATRPNVTPTDMKRTAVAAVENIALMPFLLRGTLLVALLPERMAERVADLTEIRLLPPPHDVRPLRQTVCWNPRHSDDPAHRWMRERLVEVARSI